MKKTLQCLLFILSIILLLFTNVCIVPSGSMKPTILPGEIIIYTTKNKIYSKTWKKGEVVIFTSPINPNQLLVKRISHIIKKGTILNINLEITQDIIHKEKQNLINKNNSWYLSGKKTQYFILPQNYYYMQGDNISQSSDSHVWGYIPDSCIIGKMGLILFSKEPIGKIRWNRIGKIIK